MFFDLNIPIPILQPSGLSSTTAQSKKGKEAAKQNHAHRQELSFSPVHIAAIENRVELLIHRPSQVCCVSLTLTPTNM